MSGLSATTYVSDSRPCWESEHILFSCRKTCVPRKGENLCTGPKCITVSYSGQYMLTWMLAKSEIVKCPRGIKGLPLNEEVWKLGLYSLGAEGSHRRQIFGELSWR